MSVSFKLCILLLCAALGGCASFIARHTGPDLFGDNPKYRSFSQSVFDSGIVRTAKINLYKLDPRFQYSRVNIQSFFSSVLLTGQVSDAYLKQLAEDSVKDMANVKAVHNYITVEDKLSFAQIFDDGVVTVKARANVLTIPEFNDRRILITTEKSVVYVMGHLDTSESNEVLEKIRLTPGVTKIVMLVDFVDTTSSTSSQSGIQLPANAIGTTGYLARVSPNI